MKFKTRLQVTFLSIILLPLILTAIAFLVIGMLLTHVQQGTPLSSLDYATMSENVQAMLEDTDSAYFELAEQAEKDPGVFEDKIYLDKISSEMVRSSTYIIVRKGQDLYYTGNPTAANRIFSKLPEYGRADTTGETGIYYDELEKFVKQIDFEFRDGALGSVFVVSKSNKLISRTLLVDMFIAIVLILVFTGVVLTQWLRKSMISPIDQLNMAMKKIKEGNYDYTLQTDSKGEIGDLYQNYEDMRLRLKESMMEKQQNEQQNKELISNISHDLKTPITAIKGYVEGIMDGVADTPEKMDKYIKTIYNKANDMDKLINELTTYSSIDNNRIAYNYHRINVADYFGDCVEEVGVELESKNIQLNYSNLVAADTMVIADPEQMKKVINNIISNSVKYMDKPRGVIDIRILDDIDSIRVEIEDNGKGIAQKDLQRVFERFYRTDTSRNSAQGGSGIGLSIVKKIIEDHGGYIWATGKEGEGTCMHFVLRKYVELQPDRE
ncbi:MAG: HAMP domain-containing histidine kinase [Lachnospiraceae bacterium]|nr:HAMP domain-containing histidine kinase [Lachnospiraceae bacterium]